MSDLPLWIEDIVARLDEEISDIGVEASINLDATERSQKRDTLSVVPGDKTGGSNEENDGGVTQRLAVSFLCVIALTNRRTRGEAALIEIVRRESQVIAALVGWTPAGMADPISYGRGALIGWFEGTAWWQSEFHTAQWISG